MSRSLVGSSRSSTLGSVEQQPQQLEAAPLATGQVAEPGGELVAGEAEPLQHRGRGDLAVRGPGDPADRLDRRQHPGLRGRGLVDVLGEVLERDRAAVLDLARRRARSAPDSSDRTEVLPAPLTPTMPTRSPGPSRQVACDSSCRSPRTRSTSSMSMTSLPSRWVANRCSSSRSRGGGTSSISSLAASMRNFGFEVRAGGPRRSQASSLRTRFCRRVSEAAAWRCRSALASTNAA